MISFAAPTLQIKLLSAKGKQPTRGSLFAAGWDLYRYPSRLIAHDASSEQITIPARGRQVVKTDISIAVPLGTYGRVAPRSGLAGTFNAYVAYHTVKHGLDVGAGVIDADYRGAVGVVLFNLSDKDFQVEEGDRIAQLILEKVEMCDCIVVEELEDSARGSGGFGSSGMQ